MALILAACNGVTTSPTAVSQVSATLHASVSCDASTTNNPCTVWFQYWQDGQGVQQTSHVTENVQVSGYDFSQTVNGLSPNTLYHYQVCGYGDGVQPPGACISPAYPGGFDAANSPGSQPDVGDLSATANFRTAGSSTTAIVDIGRVLTTADTSSMPISRDGGVSSSYAPGKSLWVFGDTGQSGRLVSITGTAAKGSFTVGQAPTTLKEVPSGGSSPSPFFATPTGLETPGQPNQPCPGPAAWVGGAVTEPGTSTVLLPYAQVCDVSNFTAERQSLVEYTPATNTFGPIYTPFAGSPLSSGLRPIESLGSPVLGSDGYLYLFALNNGVTAPNPNNGLYVVRVPASNHAAWGDPSQYQWWSHPPGQGLNWYGQADEGYSVSVLPSNVHPIGQTAVADYSATTSKHLAVVAQTYIGSAPFQVFEANSPTGPWTAGPAAQVPDACNAGSFGCYAIFGHPELSTSQQLVLSWFSSDDRDKTGHVRVGTINW